MLCKHIFLTFREFESLNALHMRTDIKSMGIPTHKFQKNKQRKQSEYG